MTSWQDVKMPAAQLAYGEVVYWVCITSAMICAVGPLVALIGIDNNVLNPHFLFSAIWDGKDAIQVWQVTGGEFPGGHFYLDHFLKGDGLTQFGLALGGGSALPALIVASVYYLKDREFLWGFMALWVCLLIIVSAIGIAGAGH